MSTWIILPEPDVSFTPFEAEFTGGWECSLDNPPFFETAFRITAPAIPDAPEPEMEWKVYLPRELTKPSLRPPERISIPFFTVPEAPELTHTEIGEPPTPVDVVVDWPDVTFEDVDFSFPIVSTPTRIEVKPITLDAEMEVLPEIPTIPADPSQVISKRLEWAVDRFSLDDLKALLETLTAKEARFGFPFSFQGRAKEWLTANLYEIDREWKALIDDIPAEFSPEVLRQIALEKIKLKIQEWLIRVREEAARYDYQVSVVDIYNRGVGERLALMVQEYETLINARIQALADALDNFMGLSELEMFSIRVRSAMLKLKAKYANEITKIQRTVNAINRQMIGLYRNALSLVTQMADICSLAAKKAALQARWDSTALSLQVEQARYAELDARRQALLYESETIGLDYGILNERADLALEQYEASLEELAAKHETLLESFNLLKTTADLLEEKALTERDATQASALRAHASLVRQAAYEYLNAMRVISSVTGSCAYYAADLQAAAREIEARTNAALKRTEAYQDSSLIRDWLYSHGVIAAQNILSEANITSRLVEVYE